MAFPLLTLSECFADTDLRFQRYMVDWLLRARNVDDGWSDVSGSNESDLFSTYIAVVALSKYRTPPSEQIQAAGRWTLAKYQEPGWSLHSNQPYSATGTAYALEILAAAQMDDTPAYKAARELLLSTDEWENEETVISGTKWLHCKPAAVIRGLIRTEQDLLLPAVADAVRAFQRCITMNDGWTERPGENTPTVRAQYWATFGMAPLLKKFDPAIVLPRVDAMRRQGALQEPNFLPFATGTKFHTIVPRPVFKASVYLGLVTGLLGCVGIWSAVPGLPARAISGCWLAVLVLCLWIIGKRQRQFPKVSKWVRGLIVSIGILSAVFGFSPADVARFFHDIIANHTRLVG